MVCYFCVSAVSTTLVRLILPTYKSSTIHHCYPPATSQSLNNSTSYHHSDCCTVIENTNIPSSNARPLANINSEDDRSVKLSNVLVENGRIILQYQNKGTTFGASTTPHHSDHAASAAPKRTKHKLQYDQDGGQLQYDMNDLVWKNVHAKY